MFDPQRVRSLIGVLLSIIYLYSAPAAGQDTVQLLSNPTPDGVRRASLNSDGPYSEIETSRDVLVIAADYMVAYWPNSLSYFCSRILVIYRDSGDGYELEQTIFPTIGFAKESEVNVAVSGDYLAVRLLGNPGGDVTSIIDIYTHTDGRWLKTDTLQGADTAFGAEIAFAGGFLMVQDRAAQGGTAVFALDGGSWTQVDLLAPSKTQDAPDTLAGSDQYCVTMGTQADPPSQNFAAVYELVNGNWVKVQDLLQPTDPSPGFGRDIAISGDRIVVSDPDFGIDKLGRVYVYHRNATTGVWVLEATLSVPGFEHLGMTVGISNDVIVAQGQDFTTMEFAHFYFEGKSWQLGYSYRCDSDCIDVRSYYLFGDIALEGTKLFAAPRLDFAETRYTAGVGPMGAAVTQDCNGNMFSDALEILLEPTTDCNSNGVLDSCEGEAGDCNSNGLCDLVEVEDGIGADCNMNGIPDECESDADSDGDGTLDICDNCPDIANQDQRDCDGDGVGDVCAIASGLAEDCNADGLPDNCTQSYPQSPELSVGLSWWFLHMADGLTASVQPFVVEPGMETINTIGVQWTFTVPREARIFVMRDPTQDGDLSDAVVVRDVRTTTPVDMFGTATFSPRGWRNYDIESTYVGESGETFYVGVMAVASRFAAADASSADQSNDGIFAFRYPNHFGLEHIDPATDLIYLDPPPNVQWAIRATSTPIECLCTADIAGAGGSGGDDMVDHADLMALLNAWGACADPCPPQCPADLTGNCRVDVRDLLLLLAQWGSCNP